MLNKPESLVKHWVREYRVKKSLTWAQPETVAGQIGQAISQVFLFFYFSLGFFRVGLGNGSKMIT